MIMKYGSRNEADTAPRSPWQNAYVERVIGSIRRECLNQVVIFNERHLRPALASNADYYHRARLISHSTRTVRTRVPSSHCGAAASSPYRKSAGCTIATGTSRA